MMYITTYLHHHHQPTSRPSPPPSPAPVGAGVVQGQGLVEMNLAHHQPINAFLLTYSTYAPLAK